MDREQMHSLVSGVRVISPKGFVFHVMANHGGRVTVVRAVEIRTPSEWTTDTKWATAGDIPMGDIPVKDILGLRPGNMVWNILSEDRFAITMVHSSSEFGIYATGVKSDEITESNRMAWKLFTEV